VRLPGLQKKNRAMNIKEREIVTCHESGQAIVAQPVEHADPLRNDAFGTACPGLLC
jgi:ATP-dependent Zn protease